MCINQKDIWGNNLKIYQSKVRFVVQLLWTQPRGAESKGFDERIAIVSKEKRHKNDFAILKYRGQENCGTIYRNGNTEKISWFGKRNIDIQMMLRYSNLGKQLYV